MDAVAGAGPRTPAKNTANTTANVTTAASHAVPLTSVPMTRAALPAMARPRWAVSLSRRVPAKPTTTRVANPPNVANSAICGSPTTFDVMANRLGMTIVARTARMAAGTDQETFSHAGDHPAAVHRACFHPGAVMVRG